MIYLIYFFNWLELLGLCVLIGGMIILGVLVAPTVFGLLPPMSTGGEVMSTLFMKFNSAVAYICLGLILLGFLGKTVLGGAKTKLRYLEGMSLLIILALGIYMGSFLTPRMNELRHLRIQDPTHHQATEEFAAGHRLSESLYSVNLLLGLMVLYFNAIEMGKRQR